LADHVLGKNTKSPFTAVAIAMGDMVATILGLPLTILGVMLAIYALIPPPSVAPPIKAYDLGESRRESFLELLHVGRQAPHDRVRIGCVEWSETSCITAGKFLTLFSEAGWEIDSDRVYMMEPSVPVDGVTIASRADDIANLPKLPPHEGRWEHMDTSQELILLAFKYMDNPVNFSRDPTLSPNTTGIYFGPEPSSVQSIKPEEKAARKALIDYIGYGMTVEQTCLKDQVDRCRTELIPWEAAVLSHLQEHGFGKSVIDKWSSLSEPRSTFSEQIMEKQLNLLFGAALGVA
jgi:hypothetical protein